MPSVSDNRPGWFDWLFADRQTGRIVVAQFPNLPLWIGIGLFVARFLAGLVGAPSGVIMALSVTFSLVMLWWAGLEVFQGVNPWRRFLGAAVALFIIAGWVF